METNKDHQFKGISSLDELRLEKERLMLKGRILETKLKIDVLQIRESLSFSSFLVGISRRLLQNDFLGLLERILRR